MGLLTCLIMNWKNTLMTEPEQRANSIYEKLGPIDGHIHILQLQYFCENMKHDLLIEYWSEVMVIFITIKSSSRESIRDWLA